MQEPEQLELLVNEPFDPQSLSAGFSKPEAREPAAAVSDITTFEHTTSESTAAEIIAPEPFDYTIKRQRRKTIALHVLADATVEVRAPKWVAKRELVAFVEERADWVVQQRREALAKLALQPRYRHGDYHQYLGGRHLLQVSSAGRASVVLDQGVLRVKVRDPADPEQIQKALEQWYRRQAKPLYERQMRVCFQAFPEEFQQKYSIPNITIRRMRRRWGSCSSRGEVTLNALLMKVPIECIDYVITHELCHLSAFHHGAAFYRLLTQVMPDWRAREQLLEQLS